MMDNSKENHDRIELRSDKVRDLLNERPPAILRYGTAVIAMVFLIAAAALAWWFRDTLW